MIEDAERCAGCGFTSEQAWHVEAELFQCPTCEDRDTEAEKARQTKSKGWRVRFNTLLTEHDRSWWSSAARLTHEGFLHRKRLREAGQRSTVDNHE